MILFIAPDRERSRRDTSDLTGVGVLSENRKYRMNWAGHEGHGG